MARTDRCRGEIIAFCTLTPISRNTTASLGWIAQRLEMKSAANVSQQLRTTDAASLRRRLPNEFAAWLERSDAEVR